MPDTTEAFAHAPARGWTPELKARFLDRLAAHGNARAACRAVNLSAEAAYRLRRRDAFFARGWAAALVLARENGVQALAERAIEGVEEQIYYRGELVGTRRRYDGRLLLAHLARLDALADENAAGDDASRFDELLASVAAGSENLPPERDAAIVKASEEARKRHRRTELHNFYYGDEELEPEDQYLSPQPEETSNFLSELEEECDEIAEEAGKAAAREWSRQRIEAFDRVDALCGWPGSPPVAGLPDPARKADVVPADLARVIAVACPPDQEPPVSRPGFSRPSTLSTVSTCAISRMLAPAASQPVIPAPRSPFQAPRKHTGGR